MAYFIGFVLGLFFCSAGATIEIKRQRKNIVAECTRERVKLFEEYSKDMKAAYMRDRENFVADYDKKYRDAAAPELERLWRTAFEKGLADAPKQGDKK
jgi:hypothetical protein